MSEADAAALYRRLRVALAAHRPLPSDVRDWLTDGLDRFERRGGRLDHALGLAVGPGRAWSHAGRQRRRARLEQLIQLMAEWLGDSTCSSALLIASALRGEARHLPDAVRDYLATIEREFDSGEVPKSRTPIEIILKRETRAAREHARRSA